MRTVLRRFGVVNLDNLRITCYLVLTVSCPVTPLPAELRQLCQALHQRNGSSHFGDPRYTCMVGADELFVLVTAVPELLDELETKDAEITRLKLLLEVQTP